MGISCGGGRDFLASSPKHLRNIPFSLISLDWGSNPFYSGVFC